MVRSLNSRKLSPASAYVVAAAVIGLALVASSTPTPLYGTYRDLWDLSPLVLTLVYATYAFGVLATLLLAGRVSDAVGRRPVLLVALGTLTPHAARFLGAAVAAGLNVLVAGGTQAGKTTLLNCLSAAIPPRDRVVTCEEVFELKIPLRDVASMQCRQSSLEGTGEVPLRRLVKEALRMRPSRIIVGDALEAAEAAVLDEFYRAAVRRRCRRRPADAGAAARSACSRRTGGNPG